MQQLILQVPEPLMDKLRLWAAREQKRIEEVVLEQLATLPEGDEEASLEARYEKFFRESGLFEEVPAEEKERYAAVSDAQRAELAQKFSIEKPLSEIIIEERGE